MAKQNSCYKFYAISEPIPLHIRLLVLRLLHFKRITYAAFNGQTCQVESSIVSNVDPGTTVTLVRGSAPICAGDSTFTAAGGSFTNFSLTM